MKKNKTRENIIKRWYKLTEPHKGYFLGQILFYVGYTIFLTIITIFAARTINCMYASDWNGAFLFLGLELLTIILRNVSMHIQYKFYGKQIKHIRLVVAKKVYNKILSLKDSAMSEVGKEKITNIAVNNMANLSEFPDAVASFIAYIFQVVFTLVTVFISSPIAGVIVAIIGVINFFVYYAFNKKLGKLLLERHEKKDDMYTSYCKVMDGKLVINELQGKKKYKKELLTGIAEFSDSYAKYYNVYSLKNNIYWATWNVFIYAVAALMLYFVSQGTLDIAVYLIIVPYLTTCTDKLCTLFDKTSNIENMRVDVDRVNLILNLSDKELVKYGKINADDEVYNLGLIDVSYASPVDPNYKIENVDISFSMGGINVIKGAAGSGKRIIFDLIRRYKRPDSGLILLDNLNLYHYSRNTFKNHIDYCSSHPLFINGTIKENLALIDNNMRRIKKVCEDVGILEYINKMPKGFKTRIEDVNSHGLLFLLGLARAMLSRCNILMIYEFPQDIDDIFKQNVLELIKKLNLNKTIIIFTHENGYDAIADLVYEIKNGKVEIIQK